MNDDIRALSTALSRIRAVVRKQRSRAPAVATTDDAGDDEMRVYRDLDVQLAVGNWPDIQTRKTASVVDHSVRSRASTRQHFKRQTKRFVCVVRDDVQKKRKETTTDDTTTKRTTRLTTNTTTDTTTNEDSVESRVRRLVDTSWREIPDWETLFGRVFAESRVLSPQLSSKAMEVFPKRVTPNDVSTDRSPRERALQMRKELNLSDETEVSAPKTSQDLFGVTSDAERLGDDDTDDVSSLVSEVMETDVRTVLWTQCARLLDGRQSTPTRDPFVALLRDLTAESLAEESTKRAVSAEAVVERALQCLTSNVAPKDVRKEGFASFCRRSRRRDHVDAVLYHEIVAEEQKWTRFAAEVEAVKERVTDLLVAHLVRETALQLRATNNK